MARLCSRLVLLSLVSLVLVVGVMATHETVEEGGRQQGHKFERAFKALFLSQPSGEFLVAEVLRTFLDANQTRAYHAIPVGFHPLRTTGNNDGVGNLRASIGGLLVPERSISAIDLFGASSPNYPFFSVLEQGNMLHLFFFFPPTTGEIEIIVEYLVRGSTKTGVMSGWWDTLFGKGERSTPEKFLWNFITPSLSDEENSPLSVEFNLPETEGNEFGARHGGYSAPTAHILHHGKQSSPRQTILPFGKGWSLQFSQNTSRWENVEISIEFVPDPTAASLFPMPEWQRNERNTALIAVTIQMLLLAIIGIPLVVTRYYKSPKVQTLFEISDVPSRDFRPIWIAFITNQKISSRDVVAQLVELEQKRLIKWTDNNGGCALNPEIKKDVPLMTFEWKILDTINKCRPKRLTPSILSSIASKIEPLIESQMLSMKLIAHSTRRMRMKMDLITIIYALSFVIVAFFFRDIADFLFPGRSTNSIKTVLAVLAFGTIESWMLRSRLSSLSNLGFEWRATWFKFFRVARSLHTPSSIPSSWLPFVLPDARSVGHWASSPHLHPSVSFLLKSCN